MNTEQTVVVVCPYCAQSFEILVDCSIGDQELIEDCEVCNRPVTMAITVSDDGSVSAETRSEDV
ncbi:MAG: CPXCG motif-containing cysteine-rich protein [Chlorobiaceae bacterium]|nr:CPXCG motif-containing cysteine-rich protein [Chlorobiaceae bacterium]